MVKTEIWIGKNRVIDDESKPEGQFVEIDQEKYYQIRNYHQMPDFFISIVSDSDHWMFLSSNGSLTCGRKDRNNALFPYYTDDKIHDYRGLTGSRSAFRVQSSGKTYLWEPFTDESALVYNITRNLYKSIFGNKIIFEETNHDLGLRFRYGWANSEKFGFIKKASLLNMSGEKTQVEILDGIQNILPPGIDYHFQNEFSNLLDAYKKNERIEGSSLAVYTLSSIPVDRAEPSESLKATTVWSTGFGQKTKILLSEQQIAKFRTGHKVHQEMDIRASRGAYLLVTELNLEAQEEQKWTIIAEINQDNAQVENLRQFISGNENPESLLSADIARGTDNIQRMVGSADGLQKTNTEICYARHYTNALFNIMRGGVFASNYQINTADFKAYVKEINRTIASKFDSWFDDLAKELRYSDLLQQAEKTGDTDLMRISREYLPLIFSRRHGDPSRPWNQFSIETKNEDGSMKFNYQGNWRDIFQNWEALLWSFPGFSEGIISKFVNASTIDGYNPYRIMRSGIDWERPDPADPWAYIGYWGDHQIIYLQKLLEIADAFHPGQLETLMTSEIFTYANVPYRIRPYEEIINNPKDTVVFDYSLDRAISAEIKALGADATLLKDRSGQHPYKVNFTEKIMVTLLSKLSNFIPEAGIWLNTQRPEWNDANNALVGNGTSMVTLYYLRRFLSFWMKQFRSMSGKNIGISEEVVDLFNEMHGFLGGNIHLLDSGFSDRDRKKFADFLGSVHSEYRNKVYNHSFSGIRIAVNASDLAKFTGICLQYIDQSIRVNKREDGLYHAYNLISIDEDAISIRHLYEMLEGQVAVLSAGLLSPGESLEVLDKLKASKMFREDQFSYMLYPDRQLARFIEKNKIPSHKVETSPLLKQLTEDGNYAIVKPDVHGNYHFNSDFRNADLLKEALDKLGKIEKYGTIVKQERKNILTLYEQVFDHQSFTGRSGTFYGYEGLGSIYWHMVSKLLLATQENFFNAIKQGSDHEVTGRLKQHYYEIKAGIGLYKEPGIYGAFPTDAYSHTPGGAGVKQPGLTGQVKEDFISRLIELGIFVDNGIMIFRPELIHQDELLNHPETFEYIDLDGNKKQIQLDRGTLAFTFCQVPVIISLDQQDYITIHYHNGKKEELPGRQLPESISNQFFQRNGQVEKVFVHMAFNNNRPA